MIMTLHQRDWQNRFAFAQNLLDAVADDAAIGTSDEEHFVLSVCTVYYQTELPSVTGRTHLDGMIFKMNWQLYI
jgi:hypothetical protein